MMTDRKTCTRCFESKSLSDFFEWYKEHMFPGCSVDRIDSDGHYELSNIQMLTKQENSRKRACAHNLVAPKGYHWCGLCRGYPPTTSFLPLVQELWGLSGPL